MRTTLPFPSSHKIWMATCLASPPTTMHSTLDSTVQSPGLRARVKTTTLVLRVQVETSLLFRLLATPIKRILLPTTIAVVPFHKSQVRCSLATFAVPTLKKSSSAGKALVHLTLCGSHSTAATTIPSISQPRTCPTSPLVSQCSSATRVMMSLNSWAVL